MAATPKPVDALLEQLRETLKEELRAEVRAELIAELAGGKSLSKTAPSKAAKKTAAPKTAKVPIPKAKTAAPAKTALKVQEGKRRGEAEIAKAADELHRWFKANPGSLLADAAEALKVPVKDLQLPLGSLIEGKKLSKKGERRWTRYSAKG